MDKIIEELIKYGKISGKRNLTAGISGNISARWNDKIIITSSGSANGYLEKDDFSVINFSGELLEGNSRPSSEKKLHINYYEKRPDINSVMHFHSPYLTAFASSNENLDANVSPEILYCFKQIPKAQYALPGTDELVEKTKIFFKDYDIILMENHGVIAGGKNIKNAFLNIELCESYAKMLICSKILGGANMLSEEEVNKIYKLKEEK